MGLRYSPIEPSTQHPPLDNAREEWMKVRRSLAGGSLAAQSGAANQYGDNSRQYNLYGNRGQRIAGHCYFKADGDQNFGMMLPSGPMNSPEVNELRRADI
ncbi:hypothetical protein BDV24DRAFT_145563, partial [Aspergillus arachidicola]